MMNTLCLVILCVFTIFSWSSTAKGVPAAPPVKKCKALGLLMKDTRCENPDNMQESEDREDKQVCRCPDNSKCNAKVEKPEAEGVAEAHYVYQCVAEQAEDKMAGMNVDMGPIV